MTVDALNNLVTSAIWRAEQLDELGLETVILAWGEVSRLEEELAKTIPTKGAEGRIARRGAVRAALKAKDHVRAQNLVERYTAEKGVPAAFRMDLRALLKADAKGLGEAFPFAAKHHKPRDLQLLANRLQKGGPFGLVA